MGYIIKTDTLPDVLPEGATVEREPRTFPATIKTNLARKLTVSNDNDGTFLTVKNTDSLTQEVNSYLNKDQSRELAHALLEAIGDDVPELPIVMSLIGKKYSKFDPEPPTSVTALKSNGVLTRNWYRVPDGWSTRRGGVPDSWSFVRQDGPLEVTEVQDVTAVTLPVTLTSVMGKEITIRKDYQDRALVKIDDSEGDRHMDFILDFANRDMLIAALQATK